jgi:uncharacterized protein
MKAEPAQQEHSASRVVIDTNVWLSAALSPVGIPAQIVRRVLAYGVPVFSQATFAELETRIWKPKFDRYLSMHARHGILHDARALALWINITPDLAQRRFSRDVADDMFVHAAISSMALWLVSGDQDLLEINEDLPVRIVAPAQALVAQDFCP